MTVLASALACLVLASCSGKPPSILNLKWLLVVHEGEKPREGLSVFVAAEDEDGADDIESLYVIHDKSRLYWKLDTATWVKSEESGDLWIGSNALSLPNIPRLPRGDYRVVLTDKAGERAERAFTLTIDPAGLRGLGITKNGLRLSLTQNDIKPQLVFFDAANQTLGVQAIEGTQIDISDILSQQGKSLAAWAVMTSNEADNTAIISPRYPYP